MLHISIVFGIIFLSFASGYAPFKQSKSLHSKLDPVLQARNIFQAKEKPSAPVDVTRKSPHFFSEDYLKGINLPNKLTYARALSVPLFALTFSLRLRATSLAIFLLASITDFLDGYLARRWAITSAFGAFLDPVADKLMVAIASILLTSLYPTIFFVAPVAIILCREIAVSALREWMAEKGVRAVVKVGMIGKLKTALQIVGMSLLLLVFPDESADIDLCEMLGLYKPTVFLVGLGFLYLSTLAALVSGWQYFSAAKPSLWGRSEP